MKGSIWRRLVGSWTPPGPMMSTLTCPSPAPLVWILKTASSPTRTPLGWMPRPDAYAFLASAAEREMRKLKQNHKECINIDGKVVREGDRGGSKECKCLGWIRVCLLTCALHHGHSLWLCGENTNQETKSNRTELVNN